MGLIKLAWKKSNVCFGSNTPTIPFTHRPISLSYNTHNRPLYEKLTKLGIPIIQTTLQAIKYLTNISKHTNNITTSHAGNYSIP